MTAKAGGLTWSCAPRQDVRRRITFVATKCTRDSPERRGPVRRRTGPSRQDGRRLTREPNERALWVAKEYKTHARPECCKSTPPREALKVVVSEEKMWHWLTCEGRTFTLLHEEEYSLNCRQKFAGQVTAHNIGTLDFKECISKQHRARSQAYSQACRQQIAEASKPTEHDKFGMQQDDGSPQPIFGQSRWSC